MSKRSTSRAERGLDLVAGEVAPVEQELDPLEEHAVGAVGVLLRVDDVAAVAVHEVGDGRDDPGLVGTRQQEHRGRAVARRSPRALARPGRRRGAVMPAGATLENAAAVWLSTPGIDTDVRGRGRGARRRRRASADCHTNSGRSVGAEPGAVVELGVGVARAHEHHLHAGPPRLLVHRVGEAVHERLGRAVGRVVGRGLVRGERRDVEDRARRRVAPSLPSAAWVSRRSATTLSSISCDLARRRRARRSGRTCRSRRC